jgi:CubicO group peptidase (beta-lactamase class C family)
MKYLRRFFFILFNVLSVAQSQNLFEALREGDIEADSLESRIDAIFRQWNHTHSPGGAIAVVQNGELIFVKGYGCADLENSVGLTGSTELYLGSISKQFTGYCIARLIRDGKLTLNDDIRKFIPEMSSLRTTVKVKDLVYHISGLRDLYGLLPLTGFRLNGYVSNDDVLKILYRQKDLNFPPGERWEYSNTNYFLLAEMIKRITGESLKNWAKRIIFDPLRMKNTFFVDSIETLIPSRGNSYHQNRDGSFSNDPFLDVTVGHTGLYSTAEDMSKWLIHLREMNLRRDPILAIMLQTDTLNSGEAIRRYSFGLFKTSDKALNYWHRGSLFGFKSIISYYPEKDFGFVILGNVQTFNRIRYAREVARLLHPEIAPDDPPVQTRPLLNDSLANKRILVDLETLRKYEGSYAVDSMTVYMINVQDHSLSLVGARDSRTTNLIPISKNEFRNDESSLLISFLENNHGIVDKMAYQTSSTRITGRKAKVLSSAQEHEIIGDYY